MSDLDQEMEVPETQITKRDLARMRIAVWTADRLGAPSRILLGVDHLADILTKLDKDGLIFITVKP